MDKEITMRFLRLPLMFMLLALAGLAITGCQTHDDTAPTAGQPGPSGPGGPSTPGFCNDPSQLFTIVSVKPTTGSLDTATGKWSDVSVTSNVEVTFNHAPAKVSLTPNVIGFTLASDTTQQLAYTVTISGNTATFDPTADLNPGTSYLFYVQADGTTYGPRAAECDKAGTTPKYLTILDASGNPSTDPDPQDNTPIDTTPAGAALAVTSTVPKDGGNAGTDITPKITFNQPVDPASVPASCTPAITLKDTTSSSPISGSCSVSKDGNSVTFTPSTPLTSGDDYTLTTKTNGSGGITATDPSAATTAGTSTVNFTANDLLNTKDCTVPLAGQSNVPGDGVCLLGANGKGGLVDTLFAANGPLAPLAANLPAAGMLKTDLTALLKNDDGSLQSLVTALTTGGNLQNGIQTLLMNKDTGLAAIVQSVVDPDNLKGLLGTDGGVADLLQTLATGTNNANCQSALGTVCLVGNGGQHGVLDMLLGDSGYLTQEGINTGTLVSTLGNMLQNNGSLASTVQGLFQQGNLQEGLQTLLAGANGTPGLLQTLGGTLTSLPGALSGLVGGLLGGLTP